MAIMHQSSASQAHTPATSIHPAAAPTATQDSATTSQDISTAINNSIAAQVSSTSIPPHEELEIDTTTHRLPSSPPTYTEAIAHTYSPPSTTTTPIQPFNIDIESQSTNTASSFQTRVYTRLSHTHKRFKHSIAITSALITLAIFTLELWSNINELAES